MKLVRYHSATGEKPGLILDGEVFDLSGSFATVNPRAPTQDDIDAIAAVPAKVLRAMGKGWRSVPLCAASARSSAWA